MRNDRETAALLRLTITRLHRRLRQQAAIGVTPSQASALSTLDRHGPMTLGALASAEQIRPSTVTRMVDILEATGLALRLSTPEDRRVCRVAITAKGRRLMESARSEADRYLAERLEGLSATERHVVERASTLLQRLIDEEPRAHAGAVPSGTVRG